MPSPSPAPAASLEKASPIVQFFRLVGPNNEVALCRSYRVGPGIELRFGVDGAPEFMVEEVASHSRAMTLAAEWRTMLTEGGFVEP